jgi:hypothetical protein
MCRSVGNASAACSADSSSGQDARGLQIPPGGTPLGSGYLDVVGTSESGAIVGILGYAEQKASVSGTTVSASGELNGTGVGYIEDDVTVSGTSVDGGIDGSSSNSAVSGSGELHGTTLSDVEVIGICVDDLP